MQLEQVLVALGPAPHDVTLVQQIETGLRSHLAATSSIVAHAQLPVKDACKEACLKDFELNGAIELAPTMVNPETLPSFTRSIPSSRFCMMSCVPDRESICARSLCTHLGPRPCHPQRARRSRPSSNQPSRPTAG